MRACGTSSNCQYDLAKPSSSARSLPKGHSRRRGCQHALGASNKPSSLASQTIVGDDLSPQPASFVETDRSKDHCGRIASAGMNLNVASGRIRVSRIVHSGNCCDTRVRVWKKGLTAGINPLEGAFCELLFSLRALSLSAPPISGRQKPLTGPGSRVSRTLSPRRHTTPRAERHRPAPRARPAAPWPTAER